MQVLKKDGSLEDFFPAKIISAIQKAAFRCDRKLDAETLESMAETVRKRSEHEDKVSVATLHELVIAVLSSCGRTPMMCCASGTAKTQTSTVLW